MPFGTILCLETLIVVGLLSFVVQKLATVVLKPIWTKLKLDPFYFFYLVFSLGAALGWVSTLNLLPFFSGNVEIVGRVVTSVACGAGPTVVYDLWFDKPKPPPTTT